ncbi:MAG TPA: FTR1 family protein [Vicinamibacterales bacterium]|nr:FTR1 family protein [Vicinamibacterales bacterium]
MFQSFFQALVITLREGFEAFLIIAISLAYLKKTGQVALAKAVHVGVFNAIVISVVGGVILNRASNQERLEGPLAMFAAASVTWMIVHMWRAGRQMKGEIEGRLQTSVKAGAAAFTGIMLFTVLMVGREGMEAALLLMQLRESTIVLTAGAVAGLVGAAGVAWLWSRYGHRVNLALFFQVTAIFLFVFVVQLVIQGMHEMSEQGYLPFSAIIHERTEAWGPDSAFGHILTYMLVVLPAGWLALKSLTSRKSVLQAQELSKTA